MKDGHIFSHGNNKLVRELYSLYPNTLNNWRTSKPEICELLELSLMSREYYQAHLPGEFTSFDDFFSHITSQNTQVSDVLKLLGFKKNLEESLELVCKAHQSWLIKKINSNRKIVIGVLLGGIVVAIRDAERHATKINLSDPLIREAVVSLYFSDAESLRLILSNK